MGKVGPFTAPPRPVTQARPRVVRVLAVRPCLRLTTYVFRPETAPREVWVRDARLLLRVTRPVPRPMVGRAPATASGRPRDAAPREGRPFAPSVRDTGKADGLAMAAVPPALPVALGPSPTQTLLGLLVTVLAVATDVFRRLGRRECRPRVTVVAALLTVNTSGHGPVRPPKVCLLDAAAQVPKTDVPVADGRVRESALP